jgi:N-dimethylarginine dimethylaminohydrolase
MIAANCNTNSMVGELLRVLVCSPHSAGWHHAEQQSHWRELGFHHAPDSETAQLQHEHMCRELAAAGAEVICLPPTSDLTLDAVYAHDASLASDFGLILMRPGKENRVAEARHQGKFLVTQGIEILGEIQAPGATEAGDILWLDHETLLIGRGYRTNSEGIAQIRALLAPHGVTVHSAPLPYGPGPCACLHLMSLISLLNEKTAVVDLSWLAVETVELLHSRGFRFIEIDSSERESLACNVLSLGGNRLLALAENARTNQRLREAGFDVRTFPGSELCINGSGGPTCLTRPLLRR